MTTPVLCCGLECGLSTSSLGGHFQLAGTSSIDTTTLRTGLRSIRCNPSASTGFVAIGNGLSAAAAGIVRTYLYISTSPNSDCTAIVWSKTIATLTHRFGLVYKNSDSKFYAGDIADVVGNSFGSTGISVSTGAWHLVDVKFDLSANPWTVDCKIDGVSVGQYTTAQAASTVASPACGVSGATTTADIYFDDIVVSQTAADYPIGAGRVLAFSPASDGTHSVTSTNFIKGSAGATITTSTTDSYLLVDDVPLGLTADDFINQQTASSAQYTENKFASTTEAFAPRVVDIIVGYHEQGTQACNSTIKLNDNGTEDTIVAQSGNGQTGIRYARKQYATMPADGAAWTLARFNDLRVRFGYSSDATPDVYFDCAIIEAEFPAFGEKSVNINQAVKRASVF